MKSDACNIPLLAEEGWRDSVIEAGAPGWSVRRNFSAVLVVSQFENRECLASEEYSPPRRGGVDATSIKYCEATFFRADGVVSSAQYLVVAGPTTPSAPSKEASQYFIDVASTPPLRGGECCLRTDFQTETLPTWVVTQCANSGGRPFPSWQRRGILPNNLLRVPLARPN